MNTPNIKNEESTMILLEIDTKPKSDTTKTVTIEKNDNMPQELDPTRFGDWEKNGRCSDF